MPEIENRYKVLMTNEEGMVLLELQSEGVELQVGDLVDLKPVHDEKEDDTQVICPACNSSVGADVTEASGSQVRMLTHPHDCSGRTNWRQRFTIGGAK